MPESEEAFATMVTSQDYCCGAVVVAGSLNSVCSKKRDFICMVTEDVAPADRKVLEGAGLKVIEVEKIPSPVPSGQEQWDQCGFTKLNLWQQTQYKKIFYIDADCLVVKSLDDVFDRETSFAAAPDTFPPDKFNAGVLFLKPSKEVFEKMRESMGKLTSYDGGDTGFLNAFFPNWYSESSESRLRFGYNALRTMQWMTKSKPGYWEAVEPIHCIHYCSFPKPWDAAPSGPLEQRWWVQFAQSQITLQMKGLSLMTATGRARKEVQDKIEEKKQVASLLMCRAFGVWCLVLVCDVRYCRRVCSYQAEAALPAEYKRAQKRSELLAYAAVFLFFMLLFYGMSMLIPGMGDEGDGIDMPNPNAGPPPPPSRPLRRPFESAAPPRSGEEL